MSQLTATPNVLANAPCHPTIGCNDIAAATEFYTSVLGLSIASESDQGVLLAAGDTSVFVYPRPGHVAPANTVASFTVGDVPATVAALAGNGISFEQYDMPGLQTDASGIASIGDLQSAWFKDPDGNILAVGNL